jgi:hypothetical protein
VVVTKNVPTTQKEDVMPNQTKIDYSLMTIEDLRTESISLLEELAEVCIDEANAA